MFNSPSKSVDRRSNLRARSRSDRFENREELDRVIGARGIASGRNERIERIMAADVPTAPLNEVQEVARAPEIRHDQMIVNAERAKLEPASESLSLGGDP